jgi:hypothetical protein
MQPARAFISHAPQDAAHLKRLLAHLAALRREGLIETWHDRLIEPGANRRHQIDMYLNQADIVLLLVSADFIACDYCSKRK